jgi:2-isopropylmalate synthase
VESRIKTKEIAATSRLVSRITGVAVPDHKAIVGANAFMHASGIHQDGVLKDRETYEIIQPETIGVPQNMITLSARSGRHALKHRLEELGYKIEGEELDEVYQRFLILADQKKEVLDQDLYALMGDTKGQNDRITLKNFSISANGIETAMATVTLTIDGEARTDAACTKGPINALFEAVNRITGNEDILEDYTLKSVTRGREALGEATVKLRNADGSLTVGKGISTDILEASVKAYINALSKKV